MIVGPVLKDIVTLRKFVALHFVGPLNFFGTSVIGKIWYKKRECHLLGDNYLCNTYSFNICPGDYIHSMHKLFGMLNDCKCRFLWCFVRFSLEVYCLLQYLQGSLTPSCTALLCLERFPFDVAWWMHRPQGYLTLSCAVLLWSARLLFDAAWWLHCPQGYLTPSCTIFFALLNYSFLKLYDHRDHIYTF